MPAGTITALRAQANDPQRVNIFIDGAFALGVSLNTISKEGLYVGKMLSEEEYARVAGAEGADRALQAALRFLEARPRSTVEIRERLRRKAFEPDAISAVLDRLGELGLVDDAAFARFWVENRQSSRPRGTGMLRDELRRKGIDRAVADTILGDDHLVGDEAEQVWTLARAALRKYAGAADRATFMRRMGGYLQRRGFSFDTIRPVVEQLWSEIQGEPAEDDRA